MIHSTCITYGEIAIGEDTYIGPYCLLGVPSSICEELPKINHERSVSIGAHSRLESHVIVAKGSFLEQRVWCDHNTYIGADTVIGEETQVLYGAKIYDRVNIGKKVWVGGFICNDATILDKAIVFGSLVHKFVDAKQDQAESSPIVETGAFIGMGALVIGGITIGEKAYIGAGAVVTQSVKPGRLYVGVPARNVGPAPNPFDFLRP